MGIYSGKRRRKKSSEDKKEGQDMTTSKTEIIACMYNGMGYCAFKALLLTYTCTTVKYMHVYSNP